MNDHTANVAAGLAAAARAINCANDLQATLDTIVDMARSSMPRIEMVGLSLARSNHPIETKAATDELVRELDGLQYDLDEGPSVDAIRVGPIVVVEHLQHEQRWPRYVPVAASRGVRSQMVLQLAVATEVIGGLTVYSTRSETIGPETREVAELFAAHAALALEKVQHDAHLATALRTRKLIGQALGIVMERYQLDEDQAFRYLSRLSQEQNVKLRDIAQRTVDEVSTSAVR